MNLTLAQEHTFQDHMQAEMSKFNQEQIIFITSILMNPELTSLVPQPNKLSTQTLMDTNIHSIPMEADFT